MAACGELITQAVLEEQREEITVLQSIFQDDIQLISDGRESARTCFDLTVQINIPYDKIALEAFIPAAVVEETVGRLSDRSDSDDEAGTDRADQEISLAPGGGLFNGTETESSEQNEPQAASAKQNNTPQEVSQSSATLGPGKPGLSRSLSLEHWYVRADIRYLTPLHITCTFPPLYPSESPPEFDLSCLWLTWQQLENLREKLLMLWEEFPGLPIVFNWADWLKNYAYAYLGLEAHLVLKQTETHAALKNGTEHENGNTRQEIPISGKSSISNLQTALLTIFEYDLEMQRQAFSQSKHLCDICFDEREGTEFHYFDECRHFFCNECLKLHCEMHVDGGTVLNLLCPNHECTTQIPLKVLHKVLDVEKFERWERLLLSKTLDVMGDVVYCPRCNVAVILDESDGVSRLGHCANCYFAFCTECYEPWHHGQPCFEDTDSESDEEKSQKPKKDDKVKKLKKKASGDEGDRAAAQKLPPSLRRERRLQIERNRRVHLSNLSFIQMMRRKGVYQYCPKCRIAVERISGCDMMHCSQCRTSFCWKCGKFRNSLICLFSDLLLCLLHVIFCY